MDRAKLITILLLLMSFLSSTTGTELRGEDNSIYVWVIVIVVLAVIGLLTLLIVEIVIIYKVVSLGGVPWRSVWLGQLLLLAICLCYLTVIAFIFNPTATTCSVIRFGVSFCYILIQSVLLVKILIVLSPKTRAGFLKLGHQVLILVLVVTVQVIINSQWLILQPSDVETSYGAKLCKHILFNELFYDLLASFIYIGIVGIVLIALTLWAYLKIRKLNGKPNSEAKWILITSCVTAAAWLAWIIVGALVEGTMMAALAGGLWVTGTATLLIMFVPKLHKLATLKDGEFYYEDDIPGLVGYEKNGGGIEMGTDLEHSVTGAPSYQAESFIYPASENMDGGRLLTTTLERPPSVILEEKSNMSVSSAGPSPSVVYKTNNPEEVHFTSDRHALELQHPTSRVAYSNGYSTISRDGRDYVDYAPSPQRYYTIGGHGRHSGANSVIGAPRYERRYLPVTVSPFHHNSSTLEPQHVRHVVTSPHHHHLDSREGLMVGGDFPRYAGSSSAESRRYASSASGLDSPQYNTVTRAASVIGVPRYEGPAARRYRDGYHNPAFVHSGSLYHQPVQYVEVQPRKASSVAGAPSYKPTILRPLETEISMAGPRRTLPQQDLQAAGLTHIPSSKSNGTLLTGTLPRSTRLVYKPVPNGELRPVEQRQRAFRDDILERSSVY